jgi:hypothetical protein
MAIAACKPESQSLLRNRQQMNMVKESLDEGYCDISGSTDDFALAGEFHSLFDNRNDWSDCL